ncbi:MAG: ATP-binding protein [Anaerolineae bacterium]
MIERAYEPLAPYIRPGKVLLIYGPRRVGKTTLLQSYLSQTKWKYKLVSGDDINTQQVLGSQSLRELREYVEGYELLAIDEAQNIANVGIGLKIIVDQIPDMRVIATGSSSFELAGQTGEPLTGRKRTLTLYPIAQRELLSQHNRYELRERLPEFLVFGSYPEVIEAATRAEKIAALMEISGSYLLKDVLALDRVRSSRTLLDLLKLLAFQVGSEVSINELANSLSVDAKTVQRYLDLLEKAFVIVRLGGFSRNLRQEITSKAKYYFYDNGIRNALIAQFNAIDQRNDLGQLWENFLFGERMKQRAYAPIYANCYFWRTYDQKEIDLVEEREGRLFAYEFKWSEKKHNSAPKLWQEAYPSSEFAIVSPDNYLEFVAPREGA